jgi:nicotinamidase-related amidase
VSTAVIAVHYQNDVVHPDGKIGVGAAIVESAVRLLDGARKRDWSVVSVRVVMADNGPLNSPMLRAAAESGALRKGTWGAEFHERLEPREGEAVVSHSRINAFYGSDLDDVLRRLGAQRVIVAGVATHSAVEHTARHAADAAYDVVVASDACAAHHPDLHAASLRALALHVERVAIVDEILAA